MQKELKSESKKFDTVDTSWKKVMRHVNGNPRILVVFERNDLAAIFEENTKIMERTLKSLNSFLEIKRQAFPRFYFLSNSELLDVLTIGKIITKFFFITSFHLIVIFDKLIFIKRVKDFNIYYCKNVLTVYQNSL